MSTCFTALLFITLVSQVWNMIIFAKRQRAYFATVRAVRGLTPQEFPLWSEPNHPSITVWSGHSEDMWRLARTQRLLIMRKQPEPLIEKSRRAVLRHIYVSFAFMIALLPAMMITERLCK